MHPMLSQELYFHIHVFEKKKYSSADVLVFFYFPQKRPKFTHFTRGRGVNLSWLDTAGLYIMADGITSVESQSMAHTGTHDGHVD